ncbi:MAG TPA: choice-of-anchor Q domain-containing protein [Chthonomonadaceae bacterium]|nr:choice-of-anchor Q domain-containing protein [Chthonomonadaceae bacterium]
MTSQSQACGVTQSTSGTADAPITFQALHPAQAVVHGDPKFLQPTTAPYDFRLRPASPALDISTAPLVPGDLRGYPRPLGSGWDMGCYEMTVWDWAHRLPQTPRRGQPLPTPRRHE